MKEIAHLANITYEEVYKVAINFYKQNKKGDIEAAKFYGVEPAVWYLEDEMLYDEAVSCLDVLGRKYNIGIIANQPFGTKERLEKHGLMSYIDVVVASAEEGIKKPDRKIFEIALSRANCKPHEAFMIGDRIDNDIVPAKQLGMHTIWVRQGFGKYWRIEHEFERAEFVVNNLAEICKIV